MKKGRALVIVAAYLVAAACGTVNDGESTVVRSATDVPERFVIGSFAGATPEPTDDGACRNPLIDPRDGTRLLLVRSSHGRGDYESPPGRYGTRAQELLRVDCATGTAIGIVRR